MSYFSQITHSSSERYENRSARIIVAGAFLVVTICIISYFFLAVLN